MSCVILTLANYCDMQRRLPPAVVTDRLGTPLASWRMAVLAFSPAASWGPEDKGALGDYDFDLTRRWNDPAIESVTKQPMWFYCFGNETPQTRK